MNGFGKKVFKDSSQMVKSGIVLGVGASLTKDNVNAQQGISNLSSGLPTIGNIKGAEYTFKAVKSFGNYKKK